MSEPIRNELSEGLLGKSEAPADRIVSAFCRSASSWHLQPPEGWSNYKVQKSANNAYPPIILHCPSIDGFEMNVRILQIFDERLVFHLKLASESKSLRIAISEFFGQLDSSNNEAISKAERKLEQRFSLSLFAPLLKPQSVFPTLPMLPTTPLLLIFSFLSARELCQVSQTTKTLTTLSSSDEVWRTLVASDFAVISAIPLVPIAGANSNNRNSVGATGAGSVGSGSAGGAPPLAKTTSAGTSTSSIGTAKEHYRYHYLQRLAALRREKYLLERQQQQQAATNEAHWWWHGTEGNHHNTYFEPLQELWLPELRLPPLSSNGHVRGGPGSFGNLGLGLPYPPGAPRGGDDMWY